MLLGQNLCTGNLGENIFSIGDFGSGEEPIILQNPGIAPGYSYTTNPPPNDGFYILTNNMNDPAWNNLWPSWIKIGDRSPDPNGYMMVVNASFEPGIFYEEIVDGLCENQLYEFSAEVINLIGIGVGGHHEPNLTFLLDDDAKFSSGIVPQDEQWHKYGFLFVTEPGQTTVKLTLRNNAPGGIGNDLALDNISFRPCGPDAFANAEEEFVLCSNDLEPLEITASTDSDASIQWQLFNEDTQMWEDIEGANDITVFHDIFVPGIYQYRYLSAGSEVNLMNTKCRVISDTANVSVLPIEFTVFDTICENVPYTFGTQTLLEEGFYEETLLASTGCDSFVDLFLTVVPDPGIAFEIDLVDPSCFEYDDGSITISNVSGGTGPILFSIEDNEILNGEFLNLTSGSYVINIRDRYQCGETIDVILEDPELFVFDLGGDTTINLGETIVFEYESNYTIDNITWSGVDLECTSCLENSARPLQEGLYAASAISEFGCISESQVFVRLNELENQFYKPNIFSPNEDGVNDVFRLYTNTLAIDQVEVFVIADRWGNIVHSRKNLQFEDPDLGWDGYIGRNKAATGTYAYFMKLRLINGENSFIKGDVTLVR